MATSSPCERRRDLLGDDHAGAVLSFLGGRGQVRGDDDVVELQQWARVWFAREDVERGGGDSSRPQRLEQRLLVDELAPRRVDDANAVSRVPERALVDDCARLVVQREVQRDDVRAREDGVLRCRAFDAQLAKALARHEGVECDHPHAECEGAACHLLADPAEAEQPERLPRELVPRVARPLPLARLHRRVRLRDVARQREHQPEGVLGSGDDRRFGCVDDDDPLAGRRVHVDIVDSNARATDNAELRRFRQQLLVELRARADDDRVIAVDDVLERRVEVDIHVEARLQELDPRVRDRLSDENPSHRVTRG